MLDTVRNGVMSATARTYLIVMIFLRNLLQSTAGRLQLSLHLSSSKRRENARFLGFDEVFLRLHRRAPRRHSRNPTLSQMISWLPQGHRLLARELRRVPQD